MASFYRRPLPTPPATAFSSEAGRRRFREALADGTADGAFRLLEQFRTQDEPAYCGLATLVMVLNALEVDPQRQWKGVWRWYAEEMLECCEPLEKVKAGGITFPKWCCLARCQGLSVDAARPSEADEAAFRTSLKRACAADGPVLVCSYSRKEFGQTGDGHFSPIAAMHAASDTCLTLDVARFKYPPHWVSISGLWASMKRIDPETGRERGYALLTRTTHVLWRADGERGRAVPREVRPQEPALTLRFRGDYSWTSLAAALRGTRDALAAGRWDLLLGPDVQACFERYATDGVLRTKYRLRPALAELGFRIPPPPHPPSSAAGAIIAPHEADGAPPIDLEAFAKLVENLQTLLRVRASFGATDSFGFQKPNDEPWRLVAATSHPKASAAGAVAVLLERSAGGFPLVAPRTECCASEEETKMLEALLDAAEKAVGKFIPAGWAERAAAEPRAKLYPVLLPRLAAAHVFCMPPDAWLPAESGDEWRLELDRALWIAGLPPAVREQVEAIRESVAKIVEHEQADHNRVHTRVGPWQGLADEASNLAAHAGRLSLMKS